MAAFVVDYEQARGALFTPHELELVDAANLALIAYGARCQHSDRTRHPEIGGTEANLWLGLLRQRVEQSLATLVLRAR